MATPAEAKWVTIPFTQGNKTYGLRMRYGTAKALGISNDKVGIGIVTKTVSVPTHTRRLYPGGPALTVSGSNKARGVAVGPQSSMARTNKKLVIRGTGDNQTSTVYFSGTIAAAVAWLKANASIAPGFLSAGYDIFSATGRPLTRADQ